MYARAIDEAAVRIRELRQDEWANLGLAALAVCLSLVSTQVRPVLALPLFLGGLWVGALGVRAIWRRWALVDRLAEERDAYVIPDVLAYASRESTLDRRRSLAALIRSRLAEPGPAFELRVQAAAGDLAALVSELEDEELRLDPACAFTCMRLLSDLGRSPLLNPDVPPEELRSRVHQVRAGFVPTESHEDPRELGPSPDELRAAPSYC